MFDCRTNRTPIERLGSIGFDWFLVRFRSISYAVNNIMDVANSNVGVVRRFRKPYSIIGHFPNTKYSAWYLHIIHFSLFLSTKPLFQAEF